MGYTYSRTITIQSSQVSGGSNLSSFPMLFQGTYSYLATVANGGLVTNANGYDIIFTSDSAGLDPLYWEIESYKGTTGAVTFWINIPTLLAATNTVVYMWYGNSAISTFQSTASSVWDSNYKGVYHFPNGSTLTAADSSQLGNNGSLSATPPTAGTGVADGDAVFGGSAYITCGSGASNENFFTGSGWTVEAWLEPTNATLNSICSQGSGGGGNTSDVLFEPGGTTSKAIQIYFTDAWRSSSTTPLVTGSFQHVAITYSSGTLTYFYNGAQTGTKTTGLSNATASNTALVIGAQGSSLFNKLNGALDEVRVSITARSAGWMQTSYNSMSAPTSFYLIGNQMSGIPGALMMLGCGST